MCSSGADVFRIMVKYAAMMFVCTEGSKYLCDDTSKAHNTEHIKTLLLTLFTNGLCSTACIAFRDLLKMQCNQPAVTDALPVCTRVLLLLVYVQEPAAVHQPQQGSAGVAASQSR
jgi:hypothetical protein